MFEQQLRGCNKTLKNYEVKKASSSFNPVPRRHNRKAENPTRLPSVMEHSDFGGSSTWICKNSACRAVLTMDKVFCPRCSCCICHRFDDNKDPSLWLVCESESGGPSDCCGLSCHIECAFEQKKLGVVKLGQYMQMDGSYCCASCGKVSAILGCWKKQLAIAKDARRVDVLCYRVFLSYRLLDGTSRFEELHEIVSEAKTKLEAEVGPMNGESVKMARGIVSRLAIAADVQKLCAKAIEKAEEWLAKDSSPTPTGLVVSLPAACRFIFEDVTSSSLVIVLIDMPNTVADDVKGYKLWYCKTRDEAFPEDPAAVFTREERQISVKGLQPCTEYTFRIISYSDAGDLGHSEAKCFTKSVEISLPKTGNPCVTIEGSCIGQKNTNSDLGGSSTGFSVRNLGKILHFTWAREHGRVEELSGVTYVEQCCGAPKCESPKPQKPPQVSRDLDLNVASVPDLNEDLTPPLESSRDEDIGADDDSASHGVDKNGLARSNGSGPSDDLQAWAPTQNGDVPAVDSLLETRKRGSSTVEEIHDCDSALVNGSPFRLLGETGGSLDENFEYCVKMIRLLECEGYIKQEFRLKLLTWFSLRSTEQERRIVNTFIRTLYDDPKSLAGQLEDAFGDIISCKRPRNSFTSKLTTIDLN